MKARNKKEDLKLLRKKAEELFKNKTSKSDVNFYAGDLKKLVHELEVHQIELEIINEELLALKQREIELANDKYANLYDFAPFGYFTLSKEGKITNLNFSVAAMLGKERQYLMNSNFSLYVSEKSKPTYQSFIEKVFKTKGKETCEITLLSQSNEFLDVYISGINSEENKELLLTIVDITARKKNEESLLILNQAIYFSSNSTFITDKEGIITFVNPAFTKLYGYNAEEIVGKTTPKILKSGFLNQEFYADFWNTLLRKQSIKSIEFINKTKDGKLIEVEATADPIIDENNNIIGFIGSHKDISKRKKAETIQSILLNISNNVSTHVELEDFIKIIQKQLGRIVDVSNFFLALYNEDDDTISLPYYSDETRINTKITASNTLTGYVIKTQKSLLIDKEGIEKINQSHDFHKIEIDPEVWLGVPLKINNKVIGAFVVQSYTNRHAYTEKDKEVLEIISQQISTSIELKRQENELKSAKEKAEESEKYPDNIINYIGDPVFVKSPLCTRISPLGTF